MPKCIIMPKQGLQMTEGTIIQWLAGEGDTVAAGSPLFEMETDKLTITMESPESGTLLKIVREVGETVPITELIAIVGEPGEDYSGLLAEQAPQKEDNQEEASAGSAPKATLTQKATGNARAFASPRAKTRAAELGVDWTALSGSAPDGWVIERDVLSAKAAQPSATPLARKVAELDHIDLSQIAGSGPRGKIRRADVVPRSGAEKQERRMVPFRGMRKVIAERMKQSQNENAQAAHRVGVRMTEATRMREAFKSANRKVSFNDIIALCVARALIEHPKMNVELTAEGLWYKDFVNLGIAVALDDGLVVPVIKDAERMSLTGLSEAAKEAATGAREGRLPPDAYAGGSFTISNLGMYSLEEFTAIINPPEAGILAIGAIERAPLVVGDSVEIHPVLKLTLSYDHRVIDGAPAAAFLATVKRYLENPYLLL